MPPSPSLVFPQSEAPRKKKGPGITIIPRPWAHHNHLLATSVGFASLLPKLTVTRLCSATVEISNGSCWFCCKLAVLSGSAALLDIVVDAEVEPRTALSAGTPVLELVALALALLGSLATGAAGAAAALPAEEEEEAEDAEAEIAASPEAIIVTPGPAGAAAEPARRPAVVSVAELTCTVEVDDEEATACWAPGGAGPATTVMADAMVCMVLPVLMELSWKGWACGADMGNEPDGHMQAQLQPPFAVAAAALPPEPPPATTVTAAAAPVEVELEPEPDPATTVTAAAAAPLELVELPPVPLPLPATTVTAPA